MNGVSERAAAAIALVAALSACGGAAGGGDDAGTAERIGQGSPASGALVVNEVSPRGSGADWLELVNRSGESIDLCDYFVTDALDRLDHYLALGGSSPPDPCDRRNLEPGAYLVIVADDDPEREDHAPFELSIDDGVHVVSAAGRAVDSLLYLYQSEDARQTLSRVPDGEGLFVLAEPSPGEANSEGAP